MAFPVRGVKNYYDQSSWKSLRPKKQLRVSPLLHSEIYHLQSGSHVPSIRNNNMDVGGYLEAFKSAVSEVQNRLSKDLGDHRRSAGDERRESSIMSTYRLSYDQVTLQ